MILFLFVHFEFLNYFFPNQLKHQLTFQKYRLCGETSKGLTREDIPPTTILHKHESDGCVTIEQRNMIGPTINHNARAGGDKEKP